MSETTQFVTILYFDELENGAQVQQFMDFMDRFQQGWGHLVNEHGQWWGREAGKRERLWWIGFWKDEHSYDTMLQDPKFKAHHDAFYEIVAPMKTLLGNVAVRGSIPLHEVFEANLILVSYYRLPDAQHSAKSDRLCQKCVDEFDYPGWLGGAYVSAVENNNESVFFGAWDSAEASQQIGTDGRHADLLLEIDQGYDSAAYTFLAQAKFQRHIVGNSQC